MCKNADIKRMPTTGTLELTARCNLSCKMCYIRMGQKEIANSGFRERTAAEWIDMAHQAYENGTISLLLTGGEVMLRPDFCEIYEAIAQMGFLLTIYTNATLVTDQVLDVLKKYPPHKIGVTMYGASNHTYARLCGCSNGYDRFQEGMQKLSALPSLLDLRTTIVKDNIKDLPLMENYARKFNIPQSITISRCVSASIRGGIGKPIPARLSPEENVKLIHPWITQLNAFTSSHDSENGFLNECSLSPPSSEKTECRNIKRTDNYLFGNCQAGITQYHIDWRGHMMACTMTPTGYTEPFKQGFFQAWSNLPDQYPEFKVHSRCNSCKYSEYCDSCPAFRMAETGSWYDPPEYACQEAKYFHDQTESILRRIQS